MLAEIWAPLLLFLAGAGLGWLWATHEPKRRHPNDITDAIRYRRRRDY